jgi:hypothetical protein
MTFKAEIRTSIGWNWNDGLADNGRLDYTKHFSEGCGDGQAQAVWHTGGDLLPAGASQTLDLTALGRSALATLVVTTLLRVKGLLVITDKSSTGKLVLGGSAGYEWSAPFGAEGDTVVMPPDGVLMLSSRRDGWPVDDSHKLLKLAAVGGSVTYSLVLLGTLSAAGSGSSGA